MAKTPPSPETPAKETSFWFESAPDTMYEAAESAGKLTHDELQQLWEIFQQIGRVWNNVRKDSAGQRSSWLEFVALRCSHLPSYLEEYRHALRVLAALVHAKGIVEAYQTLFFDRSRARDEKGKLVSPARLDHVQQFVVDEFIRVQIVAGGFRGFGSDERGRFRRKLRARNYNGFVRGSRYNRVARVRAYRKKGDRSSDRAIERRNPDFPAADA